MKEKSSQSKHCIVPVHYDSLDVQRFSLDTSCQLNPSLRGGSSGLGHAIDGLRLFRRRSLSKSLGSYSSPSSPEQRVNGEAVFPDSRTNIYKNSDHRSSSTSRIPRWLKHCAAAAFRPRHRLRNISETHREPSLKPNHVTSPLPGSCTKPPRIPNNLMSGAAARAAAATQNEILESVRNLRPTEPKIPRDSESGIGIELRDQWEDDKAEVVRKGE